MKKVVFISALAVTIGLASCKKDYNCVCSTPGFDDETILIPNTTKSDAENACDTYDAVAVLSGGSCSLD